MKPLIGLSVRNFYHDDFEWIGVHKEYVSKIIKCGGIPILLSGDLESLLPLCDGILLTGGSSATKEDFLIYDYALKSRKPYLGICLGMQVMGEDFLKVKNHHSKKNYVHKVRIIPKTKLFSIFSKEELWVNSRHHEVIRNPKENLISAYSEDGFIEALEKEDYPFHIGVQWHPESEEEDTLFEAFLKACQKE